MNSAKCIPQTLKFPSNSDLRDPVQVFCRLRSLQDEYETSSSIKLLSSTTISLASESKLGRKECNYVFRHIFTSYASQREIFEHIAVPLLEDLVNGKNSLIFSYGVTGSGKTFTLTGSQSMPGILPRCIDTLFNSIKDNQTHKFLIKSDKLNGFELQSENDALEERLMETKHGKRFRGIKRSGDCKNLYVNDGMKLNCINSKARYAVFISYIEIYNNTVYDLLDDTNGKALQSKIIREDIQKNMYVNGVVEIEVKSAAEAFELFCIGLTRKRMAYTHLNAESSRSHSIFNIRVVRFNSDENLINVGQLSLVDLAGSERCNRTNNTGLRLKEASSINNSLMTLRACLEILRENQATGNSKLVPYRDSRLTLLFKNYFECEGQVRMIVCINPSDQDSEENLHVLKFAELSQDVKVLRAESRFTPYKKTPKSKVGRRIPTPMKRLKKVESFTLLPALPLINLDFTSLRENVVVFENLLKILHLRKQKGEANNHVYIKKQEHFRKRLQQINYNTVFTNSEIHNLKAMIHKEKQLNNNLNLKLADVELINADVVANSKKQEEVIKMLQNTINEKNLKLNQNQLEREKNKQKFVMQTQKMNQELDEKLRRQRQHIEAEMQAKDVKLEKVRQIIESELAQTPRSYVETIQTPPIEIPEQPLPSTSNRNQIKTTKHRRSQSAAELWLEHNSVKPVPLGTVLQPMMKKRKSVSKLKKAADITNPKQNKYCLIAQETDTAGDVETKLYKGDIVPTCGGGAQVVFNDVECLRQESPTGTPHK